MSWLARPVTVKSVFAASLLSLAGIATAATDDATVDEAPLRVTIPVAAADVAGAPAAFREIDGGLLNHLNSVLPVAADEGLWRHATTAADDTRIRLHASDAKLAADGHSAVHLIVSLRGADDRPLTRLTRVRIETSLGRLRTPTGAEAAGFEIAVSTGVAELDLIAPVTPGDALLRAASGTVRVQGHITFVPELRPLIAVGIIEAGISSRRVGTDPSAPAVANTGFEDSLQRFGSNATSGSFWSVNGRAAAFVKGTVASDVLLTAAFDSNKINAQRFFADIDPNQYFPISGDASQVNYDARSTSKLYLRLDQNQNHMQYGDFHTIAPTDRAWLGSYARTLTGFIAHYETPVARASIFAAMVSAHQFVDEQPGRGLSGPYAVSQSNAVAHSEIVEMLVRDRNQPTVVLSRQTLTRYADYDFEPFSGRVIFRQAIPSVDEYLNPVSIRITYEVENGGPRYLVDGANGDVSIAENITVGARFSQDHGSLTPFKLYGADAVWRLDAHTTLTIDAARSEGNQLYATDTVRGLIAVSPVASLAALDPSGNAGRLEVLHHDAVLDARLYAAKADLTFENANAGLSPGSTAAGLHASYRLTDTAALVVDALRSSDTTTDAHRSGATAGVTTSFWSGGKLEAGLAYVDQSYNSAIPAVGQYSVGAVPGTSGGAPLNNTGFGFAGGGLLAIPLGGPLALPMTGAAALVDQNYLAAQVKVTQKLSEQATIYAQYEHTINGTSGQLAAIGGEYRVNDASRFYARYENIDSLTGVYGLGDGSHAHQGVFGFDTSYMRDGSVYNEYRLAGTESGQSAAGALGVRNRWHLAPGLNASTSVERQQVVNPSPLRNAPAGPLVGTQTATALAVSVDYVGSPLWKTAERVEYRFSDVQTDWLSTLALTRKLSDDWSLIGRNVYLAAKTLALGQPTVAAHQDRAQIGAAYRDVETNIWNVLARYEYRMDSNNTPLIGADSRTQIAAVIANYHPVRAWEFEGQIAGKLVHEILDGTTSNFNAALIAGRAIWDFDPKWDLGLLGSTTTGGGSSDQGLAVEVGYRVIDNLWLSVGGVAGRYADTELFSANSSWRGLYVRMRFKFDETTFRLRDPQTNRALESAATVVRQ